MPESLAVLPPGRSPKSKFLLRRRLLPVPDPNGADSNYGGSVADPDLESIQVKRWTRSSGPSPTPEKGLRSGLGPPPGRAPDHFTPPGSEPSVVGVAFFFAD